MFQCRQVTSGKVDLTHNDDGSWTAEHHDGYMVVSDTAKASMDMIEILMLSTQFDLEPYVEDTEDYENEFNDYGEDDLL